MNILINEKPAAITLDTEKTLGDVLAGIEQWISPTGNRIKNLKIDGKLLADDDLTAFFDKDIAGIRELAVTVSSYRELAFEALHTLRRTCILFRNVSFDGRAEISRNWEASPAAGFLASESPELRELADRTFSGEGLSAPEFSRLLEERLRELSDPRGELERTEPLAAAIAQRMEELPLDIQTGKDRRAAETVQLFSQVGEKLFRVFFICKSEGLSPDTFTVNGQSARTFIEEFNNILKELSLAYTNRDTVLVGDLAEYELAPRLVSFFSALKNYPELPPPFVSAPENTDN